MCLLNELTKVYDKNIFELIIIDQSNSIRIEKKAKEFENKLSIKYIRSRTIGLSHARNLGLNIAEGEYIMFPDDDCIIPHTTIEHLSEYIKINKTPLFLLGMFNLECSKRLSYCRYNKSKMIYYREFTKYSSSINICISKSHIKEHFDTNFGVGARYNSSEEHDFLLSNFDKNSVAIYIEDLKVLHPELVNHNFKDQVQKISKNSIGHLMLIKKHKKEFLIFHILNYILIKPLLGLLFIRDTNGLKSRIANIIGRQVGFRNCLQYF